MSPLKIKNLSKNYGDLLAVKDFTIELKAGEIFGLLGPNGAGKTTIIACITDLENPTSGNIEIFGSSMVDDPLTVKSSLGVVPQEIVSAGFFNVEEILHFILGYHNISNNKEWIDYLLKRLELYPHRKKISSHLSGGMKRRLMIAKALVHKPKLLLLDEPTAGVDVDLRKNLWEFILELNKEGMTILLTTHYLEEAEKLCSRIGVINHGSLSRLDETRHLVESLTSRRMTFFLHQPIDPIKSEHLIEQTDEKLVLNVPRSCEFHKVLSTFHIELKNIRDLRTREGSLEEAFTSIIGAKSET